MLKYSNLLEIALIGYVIMFENYLIIIPLKLQ